MRLKSSGLNHSPKIFFIYNEGKKLSQIITELKQNLNIRLPQKNWKATDFKPVCIREHSRVPDIICELQRSENPEINIIQMWQALYPIGLKVLNDGGLSFHAALIERKGKAVLLAGPGNIGKTTCCRRIPFPWKALCDDEALIVRDNNGYCVHPFPTWSDYLFKRKKKTWDVQRHLPLEAIFFLRQGKKDKVTPLTPGYSSVLINECANQSTRKNYHHLNGRNKIIFKTKQFLNACALAKKIPCFILHVSLRGRFWEKMEKALDGSR
jgi:SynChlorMet cassette protein ScmC